MIEIPAPKLWSDFDGTAVKKLPKTDPRNWTKYPLPGLSGYAEFLRGVQSSGVEVAGIVSRRPDIFIRRFATVRSVSKLGLSEFFGNSAQIVHAGSEEQKGQFVAEQSKQSVVGILEDQPHKLGSVLLGIVSEVAANPSEMRHPIVIGVVDHAHSRRYIDQLHHQAGDLGLEDLKMGSWVADKDENVVSVTGFELHTGNAMLRVSQLEEYSEEQGQRFGHTLKNLAGAA